MDGFALLTDDVFAGPPGLRDLGRPELWVRSLERSRRRREAAAQRGIPLPKSASARLSATLVMATLAGQAAPVAQAAISRGARGDQVAAAQRALGIGADGVFGAATSSTVKAFQRAHGLVVDGIVGPQTLAALGLGGAAPATTRTATSTGPAPSSSTTTAVQRALGIAADGVFGPQTRKAIRAFQASKGLTADGVVGPQTLAALGVSGTTRSAPTTTPVSDTTQQEQIAAPAGAGAQSAVAAAMSKVGAPYASGGSGPSSFDCSGLTSWAFRQAGISLPRTSFAQYGVGTPVSKDAIQAGDLVFFNTAGPGASDVGIATGPTTVVSATTHGVMNHAIFDSYWGSHFVGARRVG